MASIALGFFIVCTIINLNNKKKNKARNARVLSLLNEYDLEVNGSLNDIITKISSGEISPSTKSSLLREWLGQERRQLIDSRKKAVVLIEEFNKDVQ